MKLERNDGFMNTAGAETMQIDDYFKKAIKKMPKGIIVDVAPTMDAVPVRHGRWETNSDRPDTLICSVCKCGFDMWKHDPHNFCPNCGAKMDEVSE